AAGSNNLLQSAPVDRPFPANEETRQISASHSRKCTALWPLDLRQDRPRPCDERIFRQEIRIASAGAAPLLRSPASVKFPRRPQWPSASSTLLVHRTRCCAASTKSLPKKIFHRPFFLAFATVPPTTPLHLLLNLIQIIRN